MLLLWELNCCKKCTWSTVLAKVGIRICSCVWGVVAAAEAAGIKRKLCMEKKVWGSRKGHDRQVSTASVRRSKTQMLGRPTQVFPHVKANSLAAGLQSCTRISATDRMPSPRNSYLPEPLCRQTDRQTRGLHVYSSLYHVALSLAFSLSFSRSRLLLCWMLDLHSSVSSSSPSMISPHQSKGPKDQPLSDLITLDNRIQLHYKDSKFQLHSEVMGFNYLTKVQATSILSFALAVG